jgi:hypothetical protein
VAAKDHAERLGSARVLLCQTGWCVVNGIFDRDKKRPGHWKTTRYELNAREGI